ncbi:MAG: stage II sporulation protein M [Methanomicrobiales archaeon]|jgi:stage II sporulation protein M|nr:stage II sporulation protein M [Methanomicrobiales archaeon]
MSNESDRVAAFVTVGILIFTAILGAFAVHADQSVATELITMMNEGIFESIGSENPAVVAVNIFLNNLQTSTILFIGGAAFGLITILVLSLNGFVIGIVVDYIWQEQGLYVVLAGILPHGIFEIPALILAGMFGILLGKELWNELHGTGDAITAAELNGKRFLVYVLPLLAIAAIIEGFITPEIIQLFI